MDLFTAISERRSIRKLKKDIIPEAIILKCIEAARLAPSWANTQVWRFVVVKDVTIKAAVAESFGERNPGRQALLDAPCAVVCIAQRGVAGLKKGEAVTDKGDWFMFDCGIAMEHLVLAAYSLGLGTVHLGAFDSKHVEKVLSVPEGFNVVAMTPLGYPDEAPDARPRKALGDILFLDTFGGVY